MYYRTKNYMNMQLLNKNRYYKKQFWYHGPLTDSCGSGFTYLQMSVFN